MGHLTPTAILPGPVDDLHQQAGDAPKITRLDNQDAGVRVFCSVHDQPVATQVQCCKDSSECPTSNHSVQHSGLFHLILLVSSVVGLHFKFLL